MTFDPNKFDQAHYEAQRMAERTRKPGREEFDIVLRTSPKVSAFVVWSKPVAEWNAFWIR
jgi:hypothetical protein